jgi:hypothetical protein
VAFHALRSEQLRSLQLTDLRDGRLHLPGRTILLAAPVRQRLAAWLGGRRRVGGAGGGGRRRRLASPGPGARLLARRAGVLARAVAAGALVPVPGVSPGLAAGVHPGRGTAPSAQSAQTPRPAAAWSSFGGQWRLVKIGTTSYLRLHPAAWLPLAVVLAVLAFATSLLPSPFGQLLPLLLAAGAAVAAVAGVRGLAAQLATPAEVSFQGQVIARWVERRGNDDSDWDAPCIAVDDGERSWSFEVSDAAFGQLALGDTVAVRASPRTGQLLSLVPLRHGADRGVAAPGQPAPDLMAPRDLFRVTPGPPGRCSRRRRSRRPLAAPFRSPASRPASLVGCTAARS